MSLLSRNKKVGRHDLTIYDFEEVGDELEMHAHDEATVHMTIVSRGSVLAFGDGWEMVAPAGTILEWQVEQAHGMRALEANSRVVNVPL